MARYPIDVSRDAYHGSSNTRRIKAMRHNEIASILENHINTNVASSTQSHHQFTYAVLAAKLNLYLEDVRDVLFDQDCGHNGFSVIKD